MKSFLLIVALTIGIVLVAGFGRTAFAAPIFTALPPGDAIVHSYCSQFSFDFEATGDAPITYSLIAGPGSINSSSGLWIWTPTEPGDHSLTIRVSDAFDFFIEYTCAISATNQPPFFTSSCWTLSTVEVGSPFLYVSSAIDSDPCDIISFSMTTNPFPEGAVFVDPFGVLQFQPGLGDAGQTFAFEIIATDNNLSTAICHLDVFVPDHSPIFSVVIPGDFLMGPYCFMMSFDFEATGGDAITYGIVNGPGLIDPTTGVWSLFPTFMTGTHSVTISAVNSFGTTFYTFSILLINTPPTLTTPCGIVHSAHALLPFSTTFTAVDPDPCDVEVFVLDAIIPTPTGDFHFSPSGTFIFLPQASDIGLGFLVTVSVDDGNGGSDQCEMTILVSCCGDANGSSAVSISDVVYEINYIFSGGPAPDPLASGDANCNGSVNISDAVYLINYIFSGGAAPCAACL